MPSGCARLPSCRGRKGDVTVKTNAAKPVAVKTKEPAVAKPAATKEAAPAAASASKKGNKSKPKGPPPAAAAFLAKKKAEEEAAAAAAAATTAVAEGSEDTDDGNSGSEQDDVPLTFDTFDPSQDDFEGMQSFVKDMLDGEEFDDAGLVRLVIAEAGNVGMVIKIADEDDVYGLMSVTSMKQTSSPKCLEQVGSFITGKAPVDLQDTFAQAVAGNTGLIISERTIDTPLELSVPLLTTLLDEIEEAQNGKYEKLRVKYAFENYLVLTKVLRELPETGDGAAAGSEVENGDSSIRWLKAEDAAFAKCAHASFEFKLSSESPFDSFSFWGKAMLLSGDKMDCLRNEAAALLAVGTENA